MLFPCSQVFNGCRLTLRSFSYSGNQFPKQLCIPQCLLMHLHWTTCSSQSCLSTPLVLCVCVFFSCTGCSHQLLHPFTHSPSCFASVQILPIFQNSSQLLPPPWMMGIIRKHAHTPLFPHSICTNLGVINSHYFSELFL